MADIRGAERVIVNLARLGKEKLDRVVTACEVSQAQVANQARFLVPKVTHNLERSIQAGNITVGHAEIRAEVEANADYASYVEFGTSRSRAQPYLTPALYANQQQFSRNVLEAVRS